MKNKIKFGIVLTTKNTYTMVEEWLGLFDYSKVPILNLDLDSKEKFKRIGREICKNNNIDFLNANSTVLQDNLSQALDFFYKHKGIKWVLYMHHDAYPLEYDTLEKLNNLLTNSKKIKNFGMIGFNVYHDNYDLCKFKKGNVQLMSTARSPLELGNGYYNRKFSSRVNYKNFSGQPFAVECPMQSTILLNYSQYKASIQTDYSFNFFNSLDDVAFQFLKNGIYNIVIPNISFAHDQSLKLKHGLPFSSPNGNPRIYGRFDHIRRWKLKWGFSFSTSKYSFGGDSFINRNGVINKCIDRFSEFFHLRIFNSLNTVARKTYKDHLKFSHVKKKTLIDDFFEHDPINGPLKYFDL